MIDPATEAPQRVQKLLARAGHGSRRQIEGWIRSGRITVNGEPLREPGRRVRPHLDRLTLDGQPLRLLQELSVPALWGFYKPRGVVCTLKDPQGRSCVGDYLRRYAAKSHLRQRIFPIGRLDYDAEGLLLLTNHGELAQRIGHPSGGVAKGYLVKLRGRIQNVQLRRLRKGPLLEGRPRPPQRLRLLHHVNDKSWVEVIIAEGMYHHLRRFFATEGLPVLKIKRVSVGEVELGLLQPGEFHRLADAIVARFSEGFDR